MTYDYHFKNTKYVMAQMMEAVPLAFTGNLDPLIRQEWSHPNPTGGCESH